MSRLPGDPGYRAGWCVHYRAAQMEPTPRLRDYGHPTCEAGVEYASLGRPWPCFLEKETLRPKDGAASCDKLRPPTPDEVEANRHFMAARSEKFIKVAAAVIPWRKQHQGESFAEVIACPACDGRLHLSIAARNGHVHGHCETEGCVSWVE